MSALFVTGAGTDVGKTYVSCALLRALRARGMVCDALKPLLSGFDDAAPRGSDAALLLEALGKDISSDAIARIAPFRFRAPLAPDMAARAEGKRVDYDEVVDLCRARIAAARGLLLIEGAGGIMSPVDETRTFLDLLKALQAPALVVSGAYLGAINHALTAIEAARARGVPVKALIVSEGREDGPPFEETMEALRVRLPSLPVIAVRHGGDAEALADLPA